MERQARTPKLGFSSHLSSGRLNAHENRRAENLRRRQSPARLRRPLLPVPQAQDRLRDRGRGRGLCRELRAEGDRGDDRGRVRAACRRRRSVPHRGALAQRLRPRLFRPARHFADGRPLRHRDGAMGHRRQGGHEARLCAHRRQGARAAAQLHLPLSGRAGLARSFRQPRLFEPGRGGDTRAQIYGAKASPR